MAFFSLSSDAQTASKQVYVPSLCSSEPHLLKGLRGHYLCLHLTMGSITLNFGTHFSETRFQDFIPEQDALGSQ